MAGTTTDAMWTPYHGGAHDAFVARWNAGSTGGEAWSLTFGSAGDDIAYAVAADTSGNLYVAGATNGSFATASAGNYDAFVAKFDNNGNELWRRQFGTSAEDRALGVAVAPNGNVIVVGFTGGSLLASSLGQNDFFVAAYSPSGTRLWGTQRGTAGNEIAYGVAVDSGGSIYVAGSTSGGYGYTAQGGDDAFVDKFDSAGNCIWYGRLIGSPANDYAWRVATDTLGYVYVAGSTYGDVGGGGYSGSADVFVAKYNSDGGRIWLQQYGGGADDQSTDLATVGSSALYVVGRTSGTMPGAVGSLGGLDAFVTKFQLNASSPPPPPPPPPSGRLVAFGEGAYGWLPTVQALKSHGFVWWSVGYPDTPQPAWYLEARNNGILPLAYVNLTQNHYQLGTGYTGSCWQVANYTDLCNVDLAEPSWKTWILSRVDFAYSRGARGIKWDSAKVNTKLYPGILSTAYANMVAILQAVRSAHPDLVFMFNDGIELSKYLGANVASLVDGLQDEQRVAYLSDPAAGMRQWAQEEINDLQYFNTTYGIPVAEIEYFPADQLNSIAAWDAFNKVKSYGFAPYIVNTEFTTAGIGLSSGGPYWWP